MASLFKEVRKQQNVYSAWRHVKRSALNSPNGEIRGDAASFEFAHQSHLNKYIRELREGTFEFDGATGVLKDKKVREAQNKDPRPIVVATMKNRVIQRAILQVLQPRKARDERDPNTRFELVPDSRLGALNDVNSSSFGVGGLMKPYGGVPIAVEKILLSMAEGGKHFFRTDIKGFFTKIPVDHVVTKILQETNDRDFTDLFESGLQVHLANKAELAGYSKIFPSGGLGVAQGSSLSAFAGNVLLYDFDKALNDTGVTAIRYIDDIMIVGRSAQSIKVAKDFCESELQKFGLSIYKTAAGSEKADAGLCAESFKFVGCTFQPNRCVPSSKSISNFSDKVSELISESKAGIREHLTSGKKLNPNLSQSAVVRKIGERLFGWEKAFVFCTEVEPFQLLDEQVAVKVSDYLNWVHNRLKSNPVLSDRLVVLGVPKSADLFADDRNKRRKLS